MMWKLNWKELKPEIMPKQMKIGINQICFEIVNKGVGQLPREGYQRLPQLVLKAHKYKYTCQTTVYLWYDGHSISISACGVWGVGGKGQGSSFQEETSHTYTLRLGQSRNSIL